VQEKGGDTCNGKIESTQEEPVTLEGSKDRHAVPRTRSPSHLNEANVRGTTSSGRFEQKRVYTRARDAAPLR